MDTRFWGPSGWRLLHLISFAAPTLKKHHVQEFFELLPYVLPCKYCRASLTDYYTADPIPSKADEFAPWLFRIHNRVNGKLRDQKLLETKDPRWPEVKRQYDTMLKTPCSKQRMIGWDFLYSTAYTTPCPSVTSAPMPGAPPLSALTTPVLRNRWNVLSRDERLPFCRRWWALLPTVLPFAEWRHAWRTVVPDLPSLEKGRRAITAWLYAAERAVCQALKEQVPHESFTGLCTELNTFSSGCGKQTSAKIKTCRSKQTKQKQTLKQKRSRTYRAIGGYL